MSGGNLLITLSLFCILTSSVILDISKDKVNQTICLVAIGSSLLNILCILNRRAPPRLVQREYPPRPGSYPPRERPIELIDIIARDRQESRTDPDSHSTSSSNSEDPQYVQVIHPNNGIVIGVVPPVRQELSAREAQAVRTRITLARARQAGQEAREEIRRRQQQELNRVLHLEPHTDSDIQQLRIEIIRELRESLRILRHFDPGYTNIDNFHIPDNSELIGTGIGVSATIVEGRIPV